MLYNVEMASFLDVARVNCHKATRMLTNSPKCAVGGKSDGVLACLQRGRSEACNWRQLRQIGSVGIDKTSVFSDVTGANRHKAIRAVGKTD